MKVTGWQCQRLAQGKMDLFVGLSPGRALSVLNSSLPISRFKTDGFKSIDNSLYVRRWTEKWRSSKKFLKKQSMVNAIPSNLSRGGVEAWQMKSVRSLKPTGRPREDVWRSPSPLHHWAATANHDDTAAAVTRHELAGKGGDADAVGGGGGER